MTTKELKLMKTGPAAAAMISAGVGTLVMGLMTTGAEISEALKTFLTWTAPVGPLSGKTGMAMIAWLLTWLLLNTFWKDKDYSMDKAFRITLALIALGVLFTFPPFFEAFAE